MESWIDFAIVLFIPLMMYRGYRRGAIMMIMTFCTIFVAFFGATFLSNNFSDSVGRLIQPVIKDMITEVLEDRLKHENIIIEAPTETLVEETTEEEGTVSLVPQEYLTLSRALQILTSSQQLTQIEGFVDMASDALLFGGVSYIGSVTDGISTVIAKEIARVLIFTSSFLVIFILWLLLTRALKLMFKIPGLSQANVAVGTGIGLFLALLLVYVFAFITRGGLIAWDDVEKTILFEYFAKYNPLDSLAQSYQVDLDL